MPACTGTNYTRNGAPDYKNINEKLSGRLVIITMLDGQTYKGRYFTIEPDSAYFVRQADDQAIAVPTNQIRSIEKRQSPPVFLGLGLASIGGGFILYGTGESTSNAEQSLLGFQLVAAGIPVAIVSGFIRRLLKKRFVINEPEETDGSLKYDASP